MIRHLIRSAKLHLAAPLIALVTLVSPFALSSVSAASSNTTSPPNGLGNGFSISPVENLVTINKGSSGILTIYVENPTRQTLIAQPVINDFTASTNETGQPSLILKNNAPLPSNNFKALVEPLPNLTIASGQQKSVQVTIDVPKNANPGGYYGAIRFIPTIVSGQQSNIGLTASVGSLVLLTVPGNLVQKLSVVQLGAQVNGNPGNFFTEGNVEVLTRLDNVGNIHVAPFGKIEIKNMSGHIVDNLAFNTTGGEILPSSIRRFITQVPTRNWFGRYTIVANLGYGNSGSLITASATFWYLPVWFITLGILVIVLLVALIYWIVHSINIRRIRNSKRR